MTPLTLATLGVLVAATSVAPVVCGQTADRDGGARAVIPTFSYTGELMQDAVGGARRGTAFAGAGGVQVTLLLGRILGWHGARLFVFVLGTHGGAPSDLVGDLQGVSDLEPTQGRVRARPSRATSRCRKQVTTWSLTIPTACMCA